MGLIKDLLTSKRQSKRTRQGLKSERRAAHAEAKDRRKAYAELDRGLRAYEANGVVPPAALIARRDAARIDLLEAREEVDRLDDRRRALKAAIVRIVKRIASEREQRAAESAHPISRAEWGAAPPRGSYTPQGGLVGRVQHHTANPALPDTATIAQEAARMRQIQASHFARGFTDMGYARVVFPSGRVYVGRPESAVGAHTLGHNTGYLGISYDANCEEDVPTVKGLMALRSTWRDDLKAGGLRLYGHFQLNPTLCPGKNLKPKLSTL